MHSWLHYGTLRRPFRAGGKRSRRGEGIRPRGPTGVTQREDVVSEPWEMVIRSPGKIRFGSSPMTLRFAS